MSSRNAIIEKLPQDVRALALPNGRMVGSPGHRQAREYLLGRLEQLGLVPYRGGNFQLPYGGGGATFCNLAAVLPGADRSLPPVLIGAHYDSVIAAPCADDNAAAVAIALSAIDQLSRQSLPRDVVVLFFDAEEPPYYRGPNMGSIVFYESQMLPAGVHAAVIMDLVGHDVALPVQVWPITQLRNLLFLTGAESHPGLPDVVRGCLRKGLPVVATLNRNIGHVGAGHGEPNEGGFDLSDQYVFRTHDVPYLFLTCGHWEHYHATTDTPEKLNYNKMARICQFLVDLVDRLADADLGPTAATRAKQPGDGSNVDTADFEIELIQKAFGLLQALVLRFLGIAQLKTRADLDCLAHVVQGRHGL